MIPELIVLSKRENIIEFFKKIEILKQAKIVDITI